MILRKNGKIAFVKRAHTGWMDGYYGLPSGKVEKGESFIEAACREAHEEVGVTVEPSMLRQALVVHRNDADSVWVDMFFEVTSWQGEVINAEPHVHSELAWLDETAFPETVIDYVRVALERIAAGDHYLEYGWDGERTGPMQQEQ